MMTSVPAIVLLEFDSIAVGIEVGDAMAKRAPLASLHTGTVQPGKYLVLAGGEVADVEEAQAAGLEVGRRSLVDQIFLPDVHTDVVEAITGERRISDGGAVGVIETRSVAATIAAADAAVKGSLVTLLDIRMADGLGGKGYLLLGGEVSDVEAGVDIGVSRLTRPDELVGSVVIPQMHDEMYANLRGQQRFGHRVRKAPVG
jgi:microcompartment protein CcmL/EutN